MDKGMTHILGRTELEDATFHHVTQNNVQFKAYELSVSGVSI